MADYLKAGEEKQRWGSGGQSRPGRWNHGRGCDLPARQAPKKTPQPLRASLSLRNSWLLPGIWNQDKLFARGGAEAHESRIPLAGEARAARGRLELR
jgi:hypothetical protein